MEGRAGPQKQVASPDSGTRKKNVKTQKSLAHKKANIKNNNNNHWWQTTKKGAGVSKKRTNSRKYFDL